MRLGFIGTGDITSAMVTGVCTAETEVSGVWVSPRNKQKARKLEELFSKVSVGENNQNVVDNSDVIVLAFLPGDLIQIVQSLNFYEDQIIVNILSGTPNSRVTEIINPPVTVVRAVPLPCTSEHIGPIVIYPDHSQVHSIFTPLGIVIAVDQEEELEFLSMITALMAPYFEMLATITDWAVSCGVKQKRAADYIASMFEALSVLAQKSSTGDLHTLADESMTPGGLNELARRIITEAGGYTQLEPVLEAIRKRVTEKVDVFPDND